MTIFDRYGNAICDGDLLRVDHFATGRKGGKMRYLYQMAYRRQSPVTVVGSRAGMVCIDWYFWHNVGKTTDWMPHVLAQYEDRDVQMLDVVVLDSPSRPFPFVLRTRAVALDCLACVEGNDA